MKLLHKYISELFLYNAFLLLAGYLLITLFGLNFTLSDVIIVLLVFSTFTIISILIFLRGQTKEPDSQTLHTLVALSLKFLLEIVFALLWFIVAKKILLTDVLIFFVLYLALTLFFVWIIIKTLKNKAL